MEPIVEQIPELVTDLAINCVFDLDAPIVIPYLNILPKTCTDIKLVGRELYILVDNRTYNISNIPIFRQYESDNVDGDNRVQPLINIPYKLVSYRYYKSDSYD